ncbi:MAG: class I SAM-dependent methyltransferase [Microcoleus sp.]
MRKLKPEVAVETGVCNGFSTAFLLLALFKNDKGKLHSLDFPEVAETEYETGNFWQGKRGAVIPKNEQPGWVIPAHLKSRWQLTLGKSQEKLPVLLSDLSQIDFFFHDSEHSYECMWFECCEAYKYLQPQGVLMVDDITWNTAFKDFCKKQNKMPVYIGSDLGFLVK